MEHERRPLPQERGEHDKREQRQRMLEHYAETGSLDAPGVPEEMKRDYALERAEEAEREIKRLTAELGLAVGRKHEWARIAADIGKDDASPVPAAPDFTPEELAWFKDGEDPNRMALQESWEAYGSLDVDDVSDAEKEAFAVQKKAQLLAAREAGRLARSEELDRTIGRLDILIAQYGGK